MSRFKIINLLDKVFISTSAFLIIYAWVNFFIRNLYLSFLLSLIFSSAIIVLLSYIYNKKTIKKETAQKIVLDIEKYYLAFRLLDKNEKINLINQIMSKNFKTSTIDNCIFYKDQFNIKHSIIIATNYEKISFTNLLSILENIKNDCDEIEIICNDYDGKINTDFLKNTTINFINKTKLYHDFFLKNSTFPDTSKINTDKPKFSIKKVAKNFFQPHKAKGYFFCGLILIFSSIILPYHYYYLIFGTTLLAFGIFCKLQKVFIYQ